MKEKVLGIINKNGQYVQQPVLIVSRTVTKLDVALDTLTFVETLLSKLLLL